MPLQSSDIVRRLSNPKAKQGYDLAQAVLSKSTGGYMATTAISAVSLNNLFDDISDVENASSQVDYRCFFIHNQNGSWTAYSVRVYVHSEVADGASVAIGVDPTGVSRFNSYDPQAVTSVGEFVAPAGVTFSAPVTEGTALAVGDLAPGECAAVWVRRTAADTDAVAPDGATIGIAYERVAAAA